MAQYGQTHVKSFTGNAANFWSVSDHFGSCIKGLKYYAKYEK